jgi:SAM-dependent methyltransferase
MLFQHIFEHFDPQNFVDIMREIYRVSKHGAVINIISPYAGSDNYWTDPTHKMPLTLRTFDFFDRDKALFENGKIYGWDDVNFSVAAKSVPNYPNGPDVIHQLSVIK